MRRSLIILAAVAAFTVTTAGALADDIAPPWWRDNDHAEENRSTWQIWEFNTNDPGDPLQGMIPDYYTNPKFDPEHPEDATLGASVAMQEEDWIEGPEQGRSGIWPLSGTGAITIQIPNYTPDEPELRGPGKMIWIQLTWMPQSQDAIPIILAMTSHWQPGGILQDLLIERPAGPPGSDWIHSTYRIIVHPNPDYEIINIAGNIYVDDVVIDTICPEPTTMVLMGLTVPFILKRRNRS